MIAHTNRMALLAGLFAISGCAGVPISNTMKVTEVDGLAFMTRNPEIDLVTVSAPSNPVKYCLSVETDAVPTATAGFSITKSGNSISETDSVGAGILGGRSPGVLISRELMYRTCEFISNHRLSDKDATALFRTAMKHVEAVAVADAAEPATTALAVQDDAAVK